MSLIAIISGIFSLLRLLPSAIALINEIVALIKSLKGGTANQAALLTEFQSAVKTARKTKDVAPLEAFHKKLGALCTSNGLCDDPTLMSPTEGN